MTDEPDARAEIILKLGRDRRLAHRALFKSRHPQATPPFHAELVDLWHGGYERVLTEVFRGGGKSTLAEEAIVLQAVFKEFSNCVILGESEARAVERLVSVKHEFEHNDALIELFGDQQSEKWGEKKIVLKNGVCIQALGTGQSMRGTKHLDKRPDMAFGDDMEGEENVATPDARRKFAQWFMRVVVPAMDRYCRIRIAGTRLDPDSFIVHLQNSPDWKSVKIPWEHMDENGERAATWPERFPLSFIDQKKREFIQAGDLQGYMQEYMCEAADPATRIFTADLFRIEPVVRTWQAVYAMIDPARTVNKNSASTGVAIWSWTGAKMTVWDAYGRMWRPNEIIDDVFRIQEVYSPVVIGVEEDGLNEFIMQPLRQEQVKRGVTVPLQALKAPKGKIDFIKGLQPFFKAGEVVWDKDLPDLRAQLLSFPTGLIDVPNALAYALKLRPGFPMYEEFGVYHIVEDLRPHRGSLCYLAVNAAASCTTGVLCQFVEGSLHVLGDWVREGDAGATLEGIVKEAQLVAGKEVRLIAGPDHFQVRDQFGLKPAAARIPKGIDRGGPVARGRAEIRDLLARRAKQVPAVQVSTAARWTLNGMSGGYCRSVTKAGVLSEFAEDGAYKTLLEGVEAFASLLATGYAEDGDSPAKYAYTAAGRRYISALAR